MKPSLAPLTISPSLTITSNLNPGGWIEIKDIKFPILDNDTSFPEDCAIKKWTDLIIEGTTNLGRPADSAKNYKAQLIEAGFENVVEIQYRWPQNRWPKDAKLKELGKLRFYSQACGRGK
jgi:hypothetical protein